MYMGVVRSVPGKTLSTRRRNVPRRFLIRPPELKPWKMPLHEPVATPPLTVPPSSPLQNETPYNFPLPLSLTSCLLFNNA